MINNLNIKKAARSRMDSWPKDPKKAKGAPDSSQQTLADNFWLTRMKKKGKA